MSRKVRVQLRESSAGPRSKRGINIKRHTYSGLPLPLIEELMIKQLYCSVKI